MLRILFGFRTVCNWTVIGKSGDLRGGADWAVGCRPACGHCSSKVDIHTFAKVASASAHPLGRAIHVLHEVRGEDRGCRAGNNPALHINFLLRRGYGARQRPALAVTAATFLAVPAARSLYSEYITNLGPADADSTTICTDESWKSGEPTR